MLFPKSLLMKHIDLDENPSMGFSEEAMKIRQAQELINDRNTDEPTMICSPLDYP